MSLKSCRRGIYTCHRVKEWIVLVPKDGFPWPEEKINPGLLIIIR
jgi:hypothetical protein